MLLNAAQCGNGYARFANDPPDTIRITEGIFKPSGCKKLLNIWNIRTTRLLVLSNEQKMRVSITGSEFKN
jgi:hypothetical protein